MRFKQPIVPEYRSGEGTEENVRRLILFLKDFCQEVWTQSKAQGKAIDALTAAQTDGAANDEAPDL